MMKFELLPPQFDQIVDLLQGSNAYLAGGAVRDLLLERPVHDLDFALPKGTIPAAKKVADQMDGGFFVLDQKRQTCRVILKGENSQRLVVDFTLFQGDTIEQDLAARDFTITAMALDLQDRNTVIDPLGGAQDLLDGLIRSTSETSLEDDPLRCVRAVRLAAQLGFHILPETREQIRRFQPQLKEISGERIRDELFRLLEGPNLAAGVLSLQILGLYPYLLPGDLTPDRSGFIRSLEGMWSLFLQGHDQERAGSWARGLLIHRLGRYRERIRYFLDREMVPGRSQYQLTFLILLLADLTIWEHPVTPRQISDQIPLSNQESDFLVKGIRAYEHWQILSQENREKQPVDVFRFFNKFDQAGLAAIFLDLGENLDKQPRDGKRESWIERLDNARYFLEGYWERFNEWVAPPSLLNGDDLQDQFKLPPGPEIGSLLNSLREEQVRSGLKTRQEGLAYLKAMISQSEGNWS